MILLEMFKLNVPIGEGVKVAELDITNWTGLEVDKLVEMQALFFGRECRIKCVLKDVRSFHLSNPPLGG